MQTKRKKIPEIQVSYYRNREASTISSSADAYSVFQERWNFDTIDFIEEFMVLYLSRKRVVLGHRIIGRGGIHAVHVDVRTILGIALKCNSSSLILGHNHPSGNLKPSQPDLLLTKKIEGAAKFMDIQVDDHIILSSEGYYSFRDEGLIQST